jgi:hypothetical protein
MIINEENLEKILVANWTQFIDSKLLRDFVQNEVPKNLNSLINIPVKKLSINTNRVSLSRFYPHQNGYILWIEFVLKVKDKIAEGTIEGFTSAKEKTIKLIEVNGCLHEV